jgi:hypothetical protein
VRPSDHLQYVFRVRVRGRRGERPDQQKPAELLLERRHEIDHPDPEQAIAFGLLLVDGATREAILFGEAARLPGKPTDAVLARELTAAWVVYLGLPPRGRA